MIRFKQRTVAILAPSKSPALALLFSLLLGPVGMLYSTIFGALVMGFLEAAVVKGTPNIVADPGALIMLWLFGCIWSMISVNLYNKKIAKQISGESQQHFSNKVKRWVSKR